MPLAELEPIPPTLEQVDRPPDQYLPMQLLTRELAFDAGSWTEERRRWVGDLFESLASEWHTRDTPDRRLPLADALKRGGVGSGGRCAEIGSGTGIHTETLLAHFALVLSMDLSAPMLELAPRRERTALIRADASRLPVPDRSLSAVACVNAFLFPAEFARVLADDGVVIFVSTNGDRTPIYLPPCDVLSAMETTLGPCRAATAKTGWGCWTVVGRTP